MAKKIMALVMAIALVVCFAVSASAEILVTPVTEYVNGDAKVVVTVSGVTVGNNVTYYAKNGATPVFVDQKKAESTSVTFDFVTSFENVESDVVVGYTDLETAKGSTIPDADKYSISCNGDEVTEVYKGVTEKLVTFDYTTSDAYTVVTDVTATGAVVPENGWEWDGNKITVQLTEIRDDVELSVATGERVIPGFEGTLSIVDAGAVLVEEENGEIKIDGLRDNAGNTVTDENEIASANANKAGDRKLTVAGKFDGTAKEYGIIVSDEPLEARTKYLPEDFDSKYGDKTYKALTKDAENRFAVQLIDISTTEDGVKFIVEGKSYYTAVYAKTAEVCYVEAWATPVAAN